MSNIESPDPRMRNGWAEYQRLVLAELERHNNLIADLTRELQQVKITLALLQEERQRSRDLQTQVDALKDLIENLHEELRHAKQGDAIEDAVNRYRKWLLGLIFVLLTSVAIPVINLIVNLHNGGHTTK